MEIFPLEVSPELPTRAALSAALYTDPYSSLGRSFLPSILILAYLAGIDTEV